MYKLVYYKLYHVSKFTEIECNKFVCNKFVLVLLQIDIIQYNLYYTNCILLICNKTNTKLLLTNLLHSISDKIGHVIQIVVHQFVGKTIAKKKSKVWKNPVLFDPQVLSQANQPYLHSWALNAWERKEWYGFW